MPLSDNELDNYLDMQQSIFNFINVYGGDIFNGVESAIQTIPAKPEVVGYNIYEKRNGDINFPNFQYTPYCCFFYYIRVNTDGMIVIDHYFDTNGKDPNNPSAWRPIPKEDIPQIVQRLAINARPSMQIKNPPMDEDHNFNNIEWRRRAYVIFFLDEENWKFHRRKSLYPAVLFNTSKGSDPNFSFFDADDITVQIQDGQQIDTRTAVCMVNYMKKNAAGDDLGAGESSNYLFDIYVRAKFATPDGSNRQTIVIDPPGGNQGPPEQP